MKIIFTFREFLVIAAVVTVCLLPSPRAEAMPMFSRKYNIPCSGCHDAPAYPRLNEVGYKFRRAGFRMPEQIGSEETDDFELANYFSARTQTRYGVAQTRDASSGVREVTTANGFELREITAFPLTGSFQGNFASQTKIMLLPDKAPELQNAYARAVWGSDAFWVEVRAGIFHPFEGYGASDRPLGATRPLFETAVASHDQDTLHRLWGIDRIGAEVGLEWDGTSVSAAVFNGLQTAAQGGRMVAAGLSKDGQNAKDALVFANQMLGERSAASIYWTTGATQLPTDVPGYLAGSNLATWSNRYHQWAAFGSTGFGPVVLLAGGELGLDHTLDETGARPRFISTGAFGEVQTTITDSLIAYARFDYFDPSLRKAHNRKLAGTLGATIYSDWIKVISEVQYQNSAGDMGDRVDLGFSVLATVAY